MSDFGTTIIVTKISEKSFSSNEISSISSSLKGIIKKGDYEDALGEKFNHEFEEVDDTPPAIIVRLSEHYYGSNEKENEENKEFVSDIELPQAEEIVDELKKNYKDYSFEFDLDEW